MPCPPRRSLWNRRALHLYPLRRQFHDLRCSCYHGYSPVVLLCQRGFLLSRRAITQQHRGKQLPLVAGCVDAVQDCIEVVAQLLAEHSQHRCAIGGLQPLGVEVDRAAAPGVGAQATAH